MPGGVEEEAGGEDQGEGRGGGPEEERAAREGKTGAGCLVGLQTWKYFLLDGNTPSRRYKKYEEEVRIKKEENRVSEEAFLADVHGLKPGTEWERVARNCGFNSKVVHCKKDRARLRNVILSLKQETLLNRN